MRKVWMVSFERGGQAAYFTYKSAAQQYAALYSDASVVRIGHRGSRAGVWPRRNITIPYIPE
jgi:hypothetical protein